MGLLLSTAQKRMRLFVRASAEDPDFLAAATAVLVEALERDFGTAGAAEVARLSLAGRQVR